MKEEKPPKPLTQKGEERKSNGGRKGIFKNDEKAVPFFTSFPESEYENLVGKVHKLREPYLKSNIND